MAKESSGEPMTRTEYLQTLGGIGGICEEAKKASNYAKVKGLVLVGSFADGSAAVNSDVDFLVLTDGDDELLARSFAKQLNKVSGGAFIFDGLTSDVNINSPKTIELNLRSLKQTVIYCDELTREKIRPIIAQLKIECRWMSLD